MVASVVVLVKSRRGFSHPDEDRLEPPVVGQKLYVRCQQEDEQEARKERRVGGDQGPQRPVEQGREGARVVPGADEGQESGPREEQRLLDEHIVAAAPQVESSQRDRPEDYEDAEEPEVA